MGFFTRKKGGDVVDLTDMQRRGLLPQTIPETDNEGVVDLRQTTQQTTAQETTQQNTSSTAGDFLSSLAQVETTSQPTNYSHTDSSASVTESLRTARARNNENTRIQELQLKIDDNEYKIRNLTEKIRELEQTIRSLQR